MNTPNFPETTKIFGKNERWEHLNYALDQVTLDGLYVEFGVNEGESLNKIADHIKPKKVYGFDSFKGLPEKWMRLGVGQFAQEKHPAVRDNAELVVGWYNETLEGFPKQTVAFMHVDCDLYSSTATIFEHFGPYVVPGTIIVFDEYYNYDDWELHEAKAFAEFLDRSGQSFEFLARTGYLEVSVKVTEGS